MTGGSNPSWRAISYAHVVVGGALRWPVTPETASSILVMGATGGIMKKLRLRILTIFILSIFLFGCAVGQISYYDNETYRNLTYLIPELEIVYESFTNPRPNLAGMAHTMMKLKKMAEYEKWKGEENSQTYQQILIIEKMFNRHVNELADSGEPWSEEHMKNKLQNIQEAIALAIETELLKNKEK